METQPRAVCRSVCARVGVLVHMHVFVCHLEPSLTFSPLFLAERGSAHQHRGDKGRSRSSTAHSRHTRVKRAAVAPAESELFFKSSSRNTFCLVTPGPRCPSSSRCCNEAPVSGGELLLSSLLSPCLQLPGSKHVSMFHQTTTEC